ncbi:MAG TPA: hypothetical protein VGM87_00525 [Roseomonas sp.]|jgi:hypothetical protein
MPGRGAVLILCLSAAMAPARAQDDWTALLPEAARALRGCLLAEPDGAMVLDLRRDGPLYEALVRRADGSFTRCRIAPGDAAPRARLPVEGAASAPGPRAFSLERGCADARRVDAPDGMPLGWLSYPDCR